VREFLNYQTGNQITGNYKKYVYTDKTASHSSGKSMESQNK